MRRLISHNTSGVGPAFQAWILALVCSFWLGSRIASASQDYIEVEPEEYKIANLWRGATASEHEILASVTEPDGDLGFQDLVESRREFARLTNAALLDTPSFQNEPSVSESVREALHRDARQFTSALGALMIRVHALSESRIKDLLDAKMKAILTESSRIFCGAQALLDPLLRDILMSGDAASLRIYSRYDVLSGATLDLLDLHVRFGRHTNERVPERILDMRRRVWEAFHHVERFVKREAVESLFEVRFESALEQLRAEVTTEVGPE